jgi:hypothetical protein
VAAPLPQEPRHVRGFPPELLSRSRGVVLCQTTAASGQGDLGLDRDRIRPGPAQGVHRSLRSEPGPAIS